MAVSNFSCSIPFFLTLFLVLTFNLGGGGLEMVNAERTWCIAKPSVDNITLKKNIHYACNYVDCSIVYAGGSCFYPPTFIHHASVVMNLYYQSTEKHLSNCDFNNSAMIIITDPSHDTCRYL